MSSEITQIGSPIDNGTGSSVSALNRDGSRIVIGNYLASPSWQGVARVWERDGGTASGWKQLGSDLEGWAPDGGTSGRFGGNVAMNAVGNRVILSGLASSSMKVALVYEYRTVTSAEWNIGTVNLLAGTGALVIIGKTGNHDAEAEYWVRVGGGISSNGEGLNKWALKNVADKPSAVTMDETGDTIAIGFSNHMDGTNEVGMVRTYRHNGNYGLGSAWTEIGSITGAPINPGYRPQAEMGSTLSMNSNGTKLIVGGHHNSQYYYSPARVYTLNGDQWDMLGSVDIQIQDGVGSVDINNTGLRIIVGGPRDDFDSAQTTDYGSARIYNYDGSDYVEDTTFTTDYGTGAAGRMLGAVVCMDDIGDTVLIGAPNGNPSQGFARVVQYTGGTWSMIKEHNGVDTTDKLGYGCAMSADGSTYAFETQQHTDVYDIPGTSNSAIPQDVAGTLADTNFDPGVAATATGDIDSIQADSSSVVASGASRTALGRFSSETANFEHVSFTPTKKRSVLRNLLGQVAAKLSSRRFILTDTTEFLQFLDATVRDKIKNNIEVIQPGTPGVELNTSVTSMYCPFTTGESQTFTDTITRREFVMGLSATGYTLTVDGITQDMSGHNQEGDFYTYVDTDNSKETTFVWGSGTVSTNPTSSGGASGDPYIRTILV